jgi:plastocyanin
MSLARSRRLALAGSLFLAVGAAVAVTPVLAAEVAVAIVGKTFEPATITVAQGDTVTWTVEESINEPHSVTSGSAADAGKVFDSGTSNSNNTFNLRDKGQTYEFTFDEPGEYPYFCVIHPIEMTGTVVVLAPGASVPPSIAPPPSEQHVGIPVERRALAGGILAISIVVMFAGAWLWRRMNPA